MGILDLFKAGVPSGHQVAKLVLGGVIGMIATNLTEKSYDSVLECRRLKKNNPPKDTTP